VVAAAKVEEKSDDFWTMNHMAGPFTCFLFISKPRREKNYLVAQFGIPD
jgi:hypothetical protein